MIKPGRLFLRRLIDLSTKFTNNKHYICLDKDALQDIMWWERFMVPWNGISYFQEPFITSDEFTLFTDASGTLGMGGLFRSHWFSVPWPPSFHHHSINYKELFAVVCAVQCWAHLWRNKQILICTDNETICKIWQSRSSKNSDLMRLIRHMFFKAASLNCNILFKHIPGHTNSQADQLSRLQIHKFMSETPHMDPSPTIPPDSVWSI